MKNNLLISLTIAILLSGNASRSDAATLVYSTGNFNSSEWSSTIHGSSSPSYFNGQGSGNASTQGSGGNPGAYREVSLTVAPYQFVADDQLWSVAVVAPMLQGPVNSVSLSYDITRVYSSHQDATQVAKGIAVKQDGVIYEYIAGVSTASPPTWENFSVPNLVPLFPQVNWTSGGAITFGFFNSTGTQAIGFTINGGYDNFNITINTTVPSPSTFWLFGSAAISFIGVGLRKS